MRISSRQNQPGRRAPSRRPVRPTDPSGSPRRLVTAPPRKDRRRRMSRWLTVCGAAAVSAFVFMGGAAVETASGVGAALPASMQETTSSTLDGVFTSAQARRGRRVYNQNCASCHGQGLRGGEMAAERRRQRLHRLLDRAAGGGPVRAHQDDDARGRAGPPVRRGVHRRRRLHARPERLSVGRRRAARDKAELDKIMIVAAE